MGYPSGFGRDDYFVKLPYVVVSKMKTMVNSFPTVR